MDRIGEVLDIVRIAVSANEGPVIEFQGELVHEDRSPLAEELVLLEEDRPGLIGKIGTILGEAQINIGSMSLGRRAKGGEAMVVFSIDTPADEATITRLSEAIGADFVKAVHLSKER